MSIVKTFIKAFGLAVLVAHSSWALPTLDPTFGTHGVATASFEDTQSLVWQLHGMGVQPNGRIVLIGSGLYLEGATTSSETLILGRLLANGQPDEQFGAGGIKPVPLAIFPTPEGGVPEFLKVREVVVLSDGRFLAAGAHARAWDQPYRPWICRFRPDGELDGSFGVGGQVLLAPIAGPGIWPAVTSLKTGADGSVYAVIRDQRNDGLATHVEIRRLDAAGQLDSTFGVEGTATLEVGLPIDSVRSVIEPGPAGGILVAVGYRERADPWRSGIRVVRVGSDGIRDLAYGVQGEAEVLPGRGLTHVHGATMADGGRLVLLLSGAVARLTPAGQPDLSFGGEGAGGASNFDGFEGWRTSAGLRVEPWPAGRILFGGGLGWQGTTRSLRVTRLLADGLPDPEFTRQGQNLPESPGMFESRSLDEVDEFTASAMARAGDGGVLMGARFSRWIVVGQDEQGEDLLGQQHGFLVARIAEEVLPVLGFSLANYSIREGDGVQIDGQRSVALTVRRQGQLDQAVTFGYRAFSRPDDTATSGEDYLAVERQATLLAGWTGMQIYVPVLLDSLPEESETFSVELSAVDPGVLIEPGRASARVTILDGRTGISVTKRVSDGSAWRMPESSVEYAVEVTNWGPLDSGELRAEADVPLPLLRLPGMSLSASQGTATYQLGGSKFVWEVGSLAVGRSARMNYQLYVPAMPEPRRIESEARVELLSGPADTNPANNTNRTFLVVGGADLEADSSWSPQAGRLRIRVINQGPATAGDFMVKTWADGRFSRFEPVELGNELGKDAWTRVDEQWTLTYTGGLAPGESLTRELLGNGAALTFHADLRTNVNSGTITIEVTPLGTGLRSDPNPSNNRIEVAQRRPRSDGESAADPSVVLRGEWAKCVAFNFAYFLGLNLPEPDEAVANVRGVSRADANQPPPAPTGLAAYYGLRELMKHTPAGQRWVELYEKHTAELSQILLQQLFHPGLLEDAVLFLGEFESGYVRYLAGTGDGEGITQPMIDRLNRLADRFSELGSPELRAAIETERARFNHLQDFVGVTFADWGEMLGLEVPESPWLVASGARQLADGALLFEVNHVSGHHYTVWLTPSLDSAEWAPVAEADVQALGNTVQVRVPNPSHPAEFYRVRAVAGVANQ